MKNFMLRLKVLHIVEMTWIFFVINKGTCIDYMEGLQVSGTYSEEWCEHLAWRENTFSRDLIANLVRHLVENDVDTLHEERNS